MRTKTKVVEPHNALLQVGPMTSWNENEGSASSANRSDNFPVITDSRDKNGFTVFIKQKCSGRAFFSTTTIFHSLSYSSKPLQITILFKSFWCCRVAHDASSHPVLVSSPTSTHHACRTYREDHRQQGRQERVQGWRWSVCALPNGSVSFD